MVVVSVDLAYKKYWDIVIDHALRTHEALGRPDTLPGYLEVVHRLFENGVFVSHERTRNRADVLGSAPEAPLQRGFELLDTKSRLTDEPAQGAGSKVFAVMYRYGERGTSRTLHANVRTVLANGSVPKSFEGSDGFPARAVGKPRQETR